MVSFLFAGEESETHNLSDPSCWTPMQADPIPKPHRAALPVMGQSFQLCCWVPGSKGREGGVGKRKWHYLDSGSGNETDISTWILYAFPNSPSLNA